MNVITRVVWGVKLYNPIHSRNVKAASGNISTKEDAGWSIDEFEKGVGTLLLLLFPLEQYRLPWFVKTQEIVTYVEVQDGNVNVVEEFAMIFY